MSWFPRINNSVLVRLTDLYCCRNCDIVLTDDERADLAGLKHREYLIDDVDAVLLGLVDILMATAYDHRTTGGEPTVSRLVTHARILTSTWRSHVFPN